MTEIKCPNCQTDFKINETGYIEILKQVRNQEFDDEIKTKSDALRISHEKDNEILRQKAYTKYSQLQQSKDADIKT